MSYVVAIPSYQRADEITKKTLKTLKEGGVDKNKIYVFVANKQEEKKYRDTMDRNTYHKIVVGQKGITKQRLFISKYFKPGTMIVSIDDDVRNLVKLSDGKLTKLSNLDSFFKKAFDTLKKEKLYLWGVYPVKNSLFMKNNSTTDLRFIIGVLHGYINRHDNKLYPNQKLQSKEDVEQSILFYLKDGGILRFNNISFSTTFKAKGGLGSDRSKRNMMDKQAQEYLVKTYPNIVSPKFRKDGTPEVMLKRNPLKN